MLTVLELDLVRGYEFEAVVKWFADRVAHALDARDIASFGNTHDHSFVLQNLAVFCEPCSMFVGQVF